MSCHSMKLIAYIELRKLFTVLPLPWAVYIVYQSEHMLNTFNLSLFVFLMPSYVASYVQFVIFNLYKESYVE